MKSLNSKLTRWFVQVRQQGQIIDALEHGRVPQRRQVRIFCLFQVCQRRLVDLFLVPAIEAKDQLDPALRDRPLPERAANPALLIVGEPGAGALWVK